MSEPQKRESKPESQPRLVIHRVCTTCNNTFQVTPENYEAKQCPNCHKG